MAPPALISRAGSVENQVLSGSLVEIVGAFNNEIVVVLVERHGELVQKPQRAQDSLKGHLQAWVGHESDAGGPTYAFLDGQRQFDHLELDVPGAAENAYGACFRARIADPKTDGVGSASIEKTDWRASVDQCP